MTVAELNQLRPGDYVVHIDHGVGRFDGLVKIAAGDGRMQEAIKLVYKRRRRAVRQRALAAPHFALQVGRRRAAEGLQTGQRRLAEAEERHQEGRQGHFARADRPLRQAQGLEGLRLLARQLFAARAGGVVPLGGHARPAVGHGGHQEGHGVGPSRWTGWCAATWASARPRWRSARRSRPPSTASRSPCWFRRRSSPCSTTVRSPSGCAISR